MQQLERDFTAWLDRRDANALARVFDATSGKLLLIATHLGGGGSSGDAGDLVQSTFVAAMARGHTWDRRRPLWPWLTAILQNEARMQWRRRQRRREVPIDDVAANAATAGDPQLGAASQEVLDAVLAAIDALPLPYRQVLRLRLVHGLKPIEIAQSLEVPVGTVRAQLHRGLEQLRNALPASIGAALAMFFLGDAALLAQVRTRVLEHAGSAAPTAAVTTWFAAGWLFMNAKTWVAAAMSLLLLCLLAFAFDLPAAWSRDPAPRDAVAAVTAPLHEPTTVAGPAGAAAREVANDVARRPAALTVTVRDAAGAPIAGADVRVWTKPNGGAFWNRHGDGFLREDFAAGTTDANGLFRDDLAAVRERSVLWRRTHTLRITASTNHTETDHAYLALPVDLARDPLAATLDLHASRNVMGRIVDAAGTPVPDTQVATCRGERVDADHIRSDRDGRFTIAIDADEESWPERLAFVATNVGWATIATPPRSDAASVVDIGDVVLRTNGTVRGRVVLGDGSPVAGFQVDLHELDPTVGDDRVAARKWLLDHERKRDTLTIADGRLRCLSVSTNTSHDGTFCFEGLVPGANYHVRLFTVETVDALVRANSAPIELGLDQQLLTLDVVGEHGEPLPGASVHLDGYDSRWSLPSYVERPGFPATGQVCGNFVPCGDDAGQRVHLTPFGFVWRIFSTDFTVEPVELRHEAVRGVWRATVRVELREEKRLGKLHIAAADEKGAPVHFGAKLTAIERDLSFNNLRSVMPPEGWTWELPAGRWRVDAVLGEEVLYLQGDGGFARGRQEREVTVETGRTTELKLVAPPAGLVGFDQLHSRTNLRIETAGRTIALLSCDPSTMGAALHTTKPSRFITRDALPPGRHTFLISSDWLPTTTVAVDVVSDSIVWASAPSGGR